MTTQKLSFTLSDVIQHRSTLTDEQKEAFLDVFGKGCRAKRKASLRNAINKVGVYPSDCFDSWGIYNRVCFYQEAPFCRYVAGQSYPDEVRTVREAFTKGY